MEFGHLIESNNRNFFFSKIKTENDAGTLVSDLFYFFGKALYEVKANGLELSFNIFRWSSTWYMIKTKCKKTLDY